MPNTLYIVDKLGYNPVQKVKKNSAKDYVSPYLRQPVRRLEEVVADDQPAPLSITSVTDEGVERQEGLRQPLLKRYSA